MDKIAFRYLPEHDRFISEYYPDHGALKTAEEFFRIFGISRKVNDIRWRTEKLGIKVTKERLLTVRQLNAGKTGRTNNIGKTLPIGTIRITKKTKGEPYIKTEKGWVMLKQHMMNYPKGLHIVHLDGNVTNCNPDNLMAIDSEVHGRMTANHFWSDQPEITKTGIVCCQLENSLAKDGFDVKKPIQKKQRKGKACSTNTGEYHISKNGDKYRVNIRRGNDHVNRTAFRTLEAAICFRDSWLQSKGWSLVDERFG